MTWKCFFTFKIVSGTREIVSVNLATPPSSYCYTTTTTTIIIIIIMIIIITTIHPLTFLN